MKSSAPPIDQLTVLRSRTLTRLVQEEIVRQIKAGELIAGAKLNEFELAQRLNISRSPAREAFAALEEAGLVRLEKNRGAFIREISDREAAELYQVRRGLDETAGRLVAATISDHHLEELSSLLDELEVYSDQQNLAMYYNYNIIFHEKIVELTGNETLLRLYEGVINQMHLMRRRGLFAAGNDKASRAEHRLILEALRKRDALQASFHMGNHVEQGYKRFVGTLKGA